MNQLKGALRQIWDGPCSCTMCREKLSVSAVSCVGGHVFCLSCRQKLTACLTCRKQFSTLTHDAFMKVLQDLPKFCEFPGCSEISDSIERLKVHELWCGFRNTNCKLCNWSGQVKNLHSHCLKQHVVIHKPNRRLDLTMTVSQSQTSICLLNTLDQIFWVRCEYDLATQIISVQVIWEPDGSVTKNAFEANVTFEFGSGATMMKKDIVHQLNTDAGQLNVFKMHVSSLHSFSTNNTVKFALVMKKK